MARVLPVLSTSQISFRSRDYFISDEMIFIYSSIILLILSIDLVSPHGGGGEKLRYRHATYNNSKIGTVRTCSVVSVIFFSLG